MYNTVEFYDLEILNFLSEPLIFPSHYSLTQRKYMIAGLLTYQLQNKSIDNVLKNYPIDEKILIRKKEKNEKLILDALKYSHLLQKDLQIKLQSLDWDNKGADNLVLLASQGIFLRLFGSLNAVRTLIYFGYLYESNIIQRQIFEQLALAYFLSSNNKDVTHIQKPTDCISSLKKLNKNAGKFYGILSKLSHIDYTVMNKHFKIEDGNVFIVSNSKKFSIESSLYFLQLLDYFEVVFEYCFRQLLPKLSVIKKELSDEIYIVKTTRRTETYYNKIQKKLNAK